MKKTKSALAILEKRRNDGLGHQAGGAGVLAARAAPATSVDRRVDTGILA